MIMRLIKIIIRIKIWFHWNSVKDKLNTKIGICNYGDERRIIVPYGDSNSVMFVFKEDDNNLFYLDYSINNNCKHNKITLGNSTQDIAMLFHTYVGASHTFLTFEDFFVFYPNQTNVWTLIKEGFSKYEVRKFSTIYKNFIK